jgi:hypothetical protein
MVCFFEFLIFSIVGSHNFFNPISFLMIFSVPNVPIGEVQVCLETKNNEALPLDSAYPKHFNVQSPAGLP